MSGLDENVARFREQQAAAVARLKADLEPWIEQHSGRPRVDNPNENFPEHYVEISQALLGTAIDRYIRLHDAGVTLNFVQRLQRSGLINGRATVDQLIKLANAGV